MNRSRDEAVRMLVQARARGLTLRDAAAAAGVHVATVCRWQQRDPELRVTLDKAVWANREQQRTPRETRPLVPWHSQCPLCRARVVVRTTRQGVRFWRCGCWPWCRWASWRPRAPRNCRRCGRPRFWSHSRKSTTCSGCGMRTVGL